MLFLAMVLGAVLGYLHVRKRNIRSDKNRRLIEIPGDASVLIILMLMFFIEFFIHYAFEAHLAITRLDFFKMLSVILSGTVSGISIGRNTTYFIKYRKSESIKLIARARGLQ